MGDHCKYWTSGGKGDGGLRSCAWKGQDLVLGGEIYRGDQICMLSTDFVGQIIFRFLTQQYKY